MITASNPGPGARKDRPKGKGQGTVRAVVPVPPKGRSLADIRKRRTRRLVRNLSLWVLLPTALSAVYYLGIASPQYESVSAFKVESTEGKSSQLAGFLGSIAGSASGNQTLVVRDFVLSRDMLALLAKREDLVGHYRQDSIDPLARLPKDADTEDRYAYFLDHVEVLYDTDSGVLTLHTRAFDAETARRVNAAIIEASERMVNTLSERSQRDAIDFAEEEVKRAQALVAKAQQDLLALQGAEGHNPIVEAKAVQSVIAQLEGQLAKDRADLRATQQVMGLRSPEALRLQQKVGALEREIRKQQSRLVAGESDKAVAASVARFETLTFQKTFAERSLQSALTSLEMARVDASRQHRYLAVIAVPSLPDAPTHPNKPLGILRVLVLSALFAGLGGLVIASIREHARM